MGGWVRVVGMAFLWVRVVGMAFLRVCVLGLLVWQCSVCVG